jgi:hypothetical protein
MGRRYRVCSTAPNRLIGSEDAARQKFLYQFKASLRAASLPDPSPPDALGE